MLITRFLRGSRYNLTLRAIATVLAPVFAVIAIAALIQTRNINYEAVGQSDAALRAYTDALRSLLLDPVVDANLPAVAPVLDLAGALPFGVDAHSAPTHVLPGLDQTAKLGEGATQVYVRALDNILLPRLIFRLEGQMLQNFNNPEFLFQAMKVYLMLGSAGPLDPNAVKAWMHYDWQAAYPGPAAQPLRASLERHLAAMLDQPLPRVTLDGRLVRDARRTFSRVSFAERLYAAIQSSPLATALRPWRPSDMLGPIGLRLFNRRSSVPMTDGIPGFYTVEGFYKVLLPQLPTAARQAASESWVLGEQSEIDPNSPLVFTLQNDVVKLYTNDYARQWDKMLNDIDVEPLTNLPQAVEALYILSSPQSPMLDLLRSITRQLTLTQPPPGIQGAPAGTAQAASAAAASPTSSATSSIQGFFGQTNGPAPEPPGKTIEDRYAALIAYVGKDPGAPIDRALKLVNDLQQQLAQLANAGPNAAVSPAAGSAFTVQLLQAEAASDVQPVQRWLELIATSYIQLSGRRR